MRFRLNSVAYLFALLAAGMAAMGPQGIFAGLIVFGMWVVILRLSARPTLGEYLTVLGICVILWGLLVPSIYGSRSSSYRQTCTNNLKILALAAHNYADARAQLCPPVVRDSAGQPLHSWRMAILPYMEQQALYRMCRLDRPWDSQANAALVATAVDGYQCPADDADPRLTSYFAHDRTVWPPDRVVTFRDVTDGTSPTILFLEAPGKQVPWAKPEDLSFDKAVTLLTTRPKATEVAHTNSAGYFYKPTPVIGVAFVDGSVRHLPLPLPRETAVALLTASGGEVVDWTEFERAPRELDYAKCYGWALFLVIALLPAYRVFRRGGGATSAP